ncbi:hypothetical protein [Pseudonocardia sp. NPDC049635]|uniref:hypothetical protein n=1 Tax=Pseudonocardia sp. NPDC049635 TaxID=3155506 RepID=UPI0033C14784
MSGHAAVAAARRLHTVATELFGDEVNVGFGPVPGPTEALDSVAVALSLDEASVSGTVDYDSWSSQRDLVDIHCVVLSVTGDEDDGGERLDRCFELMTRLGEALVADRAAGAVPSGLVPAALVEQRGAGITWQGIGRYQAQWIHDERTGMSGAQLLFPVTVAARRAATTG